ncbi:hypothetical protein [Streptomyces sp. DH12]|uniref:hypothetical protein n=1 Tax=Streptomyces sp. DH12 TaxID=2857010 RepID=UPI001E47A5AF|nr:hypothetical protein [Streptomyces sp. DH12]
MTLLPPLPLRRAAGGGAALAVLLAAGASAAAAPALAEEAPPAVIEVGFLSPGALPRPAGALTEAHFLTHQFSLSGQRPDGARVTGAEITVDFGGAADVAEFRFRSECRVAGTLATCPVTMPDGSGDPEAYVPFLVRPKLGTAAGARGLVRATVRADNARPALTAPTELPITVADRDRVVLGGFPDPPSLTVPPGGRAALPFVLTNTGARPLGRVTLTADGFDGDETVVFPGDHRNCRYTTKDPKDPASARTGMSCEFATAVEPGATYRTAPGLSVAMAGLAEHGRVQLTASVGAPAGKGVAGRSAPLVLVPATSPLPPRVPVPVDAYTADVPPVVSVRGEHAADGAAVGASVRTEVGREVTARVGVENRGGAPLAAPSVLVEVPRGVEVVRPDPRCRPERALPWRTTDVRPTFGDHPGDAAPVPTGTVHRCTDPAGLAPGGRRLFSFALRPTQVLDGAKGVVFHPTPGPYEGSHRTKVAFLSVTATAAATAGPSPSATPSPNPTATSSPVAAPTTAPTTAAAVPSSGSLAATGTGNAPVLLGVAAALTAAGVLLVVRRRAAAPEARDPR